MSKIEWTHRPGTKSEVWNPTTGCDKVSQGCKFCYAEVMHKRLRGMGQKKYQHPFLGHLQMHDEELLKPLSWRKPRTVFVNSMSDLFHKDVSWLFLDKVFAVMVLTYQNTYQVLTKRADRLHEYFAQGKEKLVQRWEDATYELGLHDKNDDPDAPACYVFNICEDQWPRPNIWLGVSAEDQATLDERAFTLLQVPAYVRFLSLEPLLGPIDLSKWIGYIRHHETISGIGKANLQSGSESRIGDRQQGSDMANSKTGMGSMVTEDCNTTMQKSTSGEKSGVRLPTGQSDVQQGPDLHNRSQVVIPSLQGANSSGSDGEPQERKEVGQQTEQSGTGNEPRTTIACTPCAEGESEGFETKRREESHGSADESGHQGYSEEKGKGGEAEVNSGILRDSISNGIKNIPGLAMGSYFWIIQGGESGHKARPAHPDWFRSVRDQCKAAGIPYFFKQHGAWEVIDIHRIDQPMSTLGYFDEQQKFVECEDWRYLPSNIGYLPDDKRVPMTMVGKKESGHVLDGVEHLEFPA